MQPYLCVKPVSSDYAVPFRCCSDWAIGSSLSHFSPANEIRPESHCNPGRLGILFSKFFMLSVTILDSQSIDKCGKGKKNVKPYRSLEPGNFEPDVLPNCYSIDTTTLAFIWCIALKVHVMNNLEKNKPLNIWENGIYRCIDYIFLFWLKTRGVVT